MNEVEFSDLFEKTVTIPLLAEGFRKQGNCLYFADELRNVSLLRLGGKMELPGSIAHIIGFRHCFLPNLEGNESEEFESEVFSYPFKFKPSETEAWGGSSIEYISQNLSYDYERFEFENQSEDFVRNYLECVREAVKSVMQWAKSFSLSEFARAIEENGESAWVEKLWVQAYAQKTSNKK